MIVVTIATAITSIVAPRRCATGSGLAAMVDTGSTDAEVVTGKGFNYSSPYLHE